MCCFHDEGLARRNRCQDWWAAMRFHIYAVTHRLSRHNQDFATLSARRLRALPTKHVITVDNLMACYVQYAISTTRYADNEIIICEQLSGWQLFVARIVQSDRLRNSLKAKSGTRESNLGSLFFGRISAVVRSRFITHVWSSDKARLVKCAERRVGFAVKAASWNSADR
jgi:hypothetical protein